MKLYQLAVNLRAICDNNKALLLQVMPRLRLDEREVESIVVSACKEPPKGISKTLREIIGLGPSTGSGTGEPQKGEVYPNVTNNPANRRDYLFLSAHGALHPDTPAGRYLRCKAYNIFSNNRVWLRKKSYICSVKLKTLWM